MSKPSVVAVPAIFVQAVLDRNVGVASLSLTVRLRYSGVTFLTALFAGQLYSLRRTPLQ